ncbi:hypothetical protein [Nannocystis pusilla]|uniref:Uncharacterized protein n=1 Tax=Nannocystis pusilla TaxID=889268 RepID=A0ABS7U344_9BACT|nr:hypothetical protein [Nannocystis pusilla]MBZ5714888.1 hypothetical protein [Nannocystis pusilla]
MTTTLDEPTPGEPTAGETASSSATEPGEALPPTISDMKVAPKLLESAGLITVEVEVEHADVVTITVDGGEPVALASVSDTLFTGDIAVFGESWNGDHVVEAIAARDAETSEPRTDTFTVVAPAAGGELWLKKSPLVPSYGNAVDVDDQGDVLELFTHATPQGQECFLRRRDDKGVPVWIGDSRWIAQGSDCVGEDVRFAPDGTIWVLVNVYENGFGRWQLWHLDDEGLPLGQTPEDGSLTHLGRGLDVNDAGDVLLCGTWPATQADDDAWVRLQRAVGEPWTVPWDYRSPFEPDKEHQFSERTRDCAFVEDRIVVVGEAWGAHQQGNQEGQNRGFSVEFSFSAMTLAEVVNPGTPAWHSGHLAVAADELGGYVTAGYNCGAMITPCNDTRGGLRWFALGATEVDMKAMPEARRVMDVARSPSGYVVAAAEGLQADEGFIVQGWFSGATDPVVNYTGAKTKLQVATGIAADPVGFILAGGYYQEADDTLAAGIVKLHPY